ncbi:general transcription factor 3C polypeptide 6 isoform X2 [Hippocampus comes]|uniref:general transcription factor 3C polypeptide 6 isoform X2 n=1 Tax=Hippocampus comes TaxID=109280 RepID=UPI00094EFF8F|nr:PREDICTED: general transcription factor 3C polypeptide 6 isoform X2 [Hippocampus comes]
MDDEWEDEEQLVVVELSGIINNDAMFKSWGTCKILDIDSEQPMMQVGQYVFAGEYEDALGTCVLFEEGPGKEGSVPELKYKCHTVKKLMMQRVFLSEKKENESDAAGEGDKQCDTVCQSSEERKKEDEDLAAG